ncbi:HemK family protein methyltransferase [Nocardia otitidiscaviarum]|nr:HemK family protein methyltransferase [Nocardia otitidiscaviarum]
MVAVRFDELVARLRAAGCVFAEDEARLLVGAAADAERLDALVARRVSGVPLEYVLGWVEFRGVRVRVAEGVFVPRQRSGYLVEQAVKLARARVGGAAQTARPASAHGMPPVTSEAVEVVAVDMCCGCGALGLAFTTELAAEGISVELAAADIEPGAVACARRNLEVLRARVFQGDLFAALPGELAGRVDVLLANTPYVPSEAIAGMPPEAREYEPLSALDGGADGLDIFRRVAAAAPEWLTPGGHVLVETSAGQAETAVGILTAHGLTPKVAADEESGATVVIGSLAGSVDV